MSSSTEPADELRSPKVPRLSNRDDRIVSESTVAESAANRLRVLLDRLEEKSDLRKPGDGTLFKDETTRTDGTFSEHLRLMEAEMWDTVPNVLLRPARFEKQAPADSEKRTPPGRRTSMTSPVVEVNCTRIKCSRCPSIFDDERTLKLHQFAKHRVKPTRGEHR